MKNLWRILNLKALPVLALAVLAFAAAGASAQSDEALTLDIKRQNAGLALVTLARSSGMQIMLEEETGAKVQVEGLKGEYRFEDALAALLADTGLTYEYVSENVVLVQEAEQAVEQAVDEADEEDEEDKEDNKLVLADQIVTGSRLEAGDPTARVYSFTAEDIARRGTGNLEEFFRTLPWVYSSITSQTTSQPNDSAPNDSDEVGVFGLGVSTVNMRALGSANTLVLINGQRVVGTAGNEGGFVNLSNIPMGSIKRIDVQLDGSSSVYGADAIGGVINIITKKSYEGLSATYRREFSATDADSRKMDMQAGYAWESGHGIANLSRSSYQAINHHKIYTSNDFRDLFGPEYDLRNPLLGQPGIVCPWNGNYRYIGCLVDYTVYPPVIQQRLPVGHSGVGATPDDFVNVRPWNDAILGDLVEPQNGGLSTHDSIGLTVTQYIGDKFRVYARAMVSNRDSYRQYRVQLTRFLIPASNAYNPFGEPVVVTYDPSREIEDGQFPSGYTETWDKLRRYSASFDWRLGRHRLSVYVSHSDSERQGLRTDYFYNREEFDPNATKFYEALASSDPAVAVNLFGDGTVQGSGFQYIASPGTTPTHSNSELTSVQPTLRGSLFHVWGGSIGYAVGAEWSRRATWFAYLVRAEDGSFYDYNAKVDATGVERPTVDTSSYFAELSFPIVGRENARPGLLSLVLSAKARLDVYDSSGALGGQVGERRTGPLRRFVHGEGWQTVAEAPYQVRVGEIDFGEVSRRKMSPRVGLSYRPVEDIRVRAAWSESFRPPRFSQVFNTADTQSFQSRVNDPLHPVRPYDTAAVEYLFITYKPNLEPESSDNYSLSFEWSPKAIPGFTWKVDWSLIEYTNKIISSQSLLRSHPEIAYGLPEIVDRDENGYLLRIKYHSINLATRVSELVHNDFKYAFDTRFGHFTPTLRYTRVLEDYSQVSPGSERLVTSGTTAGMNESEVVASLGWTAGRISANLFIRYIPEWEGTSGQITCLWVVGDCFSPYQQLPRLEADSLVTVDLTMNYRFNNGLRLRAGGRNIFSAESPVIWNRRPYDPTRWNARARVLFLEMNWEM